MSRPSSPPEFESHAPTARQIPAPLPERVELAPGYSICRVVNGCWQLAADHAATAPDGRQSVERLLALAEAGFTTFDAADIYTGVEELLGEVASAWRRRHPGAPALELHTKYVPDRSALAGLRFADVERAVDRSLARLGVERLDLVQFHWWDYEIPGWLETAGWLDRLRREGKIARVGLTNFDLPRLEAIVDSGVEIASHQVQYSLLDRRPEGDMADFCRERGIGLIAYGVLAGGFLSERWLGAPDPAGREPDRSKAKYRLIVDELGGWEALQELVRQLDREARAAGVTIANLAARWTLARPGVAAVLLGAGSAAHAAENLRLFGRDRETAEPPGLERFLAEHPGPRGAIYELERRPGGRHRAILRTELHRGSAESSTPATGEGDRRPSRRRRPLAVLFALVAALLTTGCAGPPLPERYLESYFRTFPTRATAAGRHDRDRQLEDLHPAARRAWFEHNLGVARAAERGLAWPEIDPDLALDLELVSRAARRQILAFGPLDRPRTDPLFWTGLLGNATVFLLVRDDLPAGERISRAAIRARLLPRLAAQAEAALDGDPRRVSPELAALAARQASASARFYRERFAEAAGAEGEAAAELAAAGALAADALESLAGFLGELAGRASGDFRLGPIAYAELFRVVTGVDTPVDRVLAAAESDLVAKRRETAAYGRRVWAEVMAGEEAPADDAELVRALFARVAEDHAPSAEAFIDQYRSLVAESIAFVRRRQLVSLPEPLRIRIDRSPDYFLGQSVGGVYPPGPYASPEAETLLFLPTPPPDADGQALAAFFRDFNDHFNRMITPHEFVPGHTLQLAWAARHPRKARAIFADGVYVEGWGTFCERLMLDLGWGGPLDRLAHLKKQLENIARTIVDIRVHTQGMERDEVIDYVRSEALQDEQFAANMWRRAMTSSPQLTFYHLGYRQVSDLFADVRRAEGDAFSVRRFLDGMMELGPVPVRHYRERWLSPADRAAG